MKTNYIKILANQIGYHGSHYDPRDGTQYSAVSLLVLPENRCWNRFRDVNRDHQNDISEKSDPNYERSLPPPKDLGNRICQQESDWVKYYPCGERPPSNVNQFYCNDVSPK